MIKQLFNSKNRLKATVIDHLEAPHQYVNDFRFVRVRYDNGSEGILAASTYDRDLEIGDCITAIDDQRKDFALHRGPDGETFVHVYAINSKEHERVEAVTTISEIDTIGHDESVMDWQLERLQMKLFELQALVFNDPNSWHDPVARMVGRWAGRQALKHGSDRFEDDGSFKAPEKASTAPEADAQPA